MVMKRERSAAQLRAAEAQSAIDGFAHRTAECHALFKLQGDRFAHQLRVQFRLVNFLNINEDIALRALGQVRLRPRYTRGNAS